MLTMKENLKKRIVVGISGASGAPIAVEVLRRLRADDGVEVHLIVTKSAVLTIESEEKLSVEEVEALADYSYDMADVGARPASGSYHMDAMIVVPCSMKTVAGIHSGYADNLLLRAADVMMKEHGQFCTTMSFPGHKESVVTEKWAKIIWQRKKVPVTVTAGIHYDNATKEMIQSVVEVTERMLQKVLDGQMETRKGVCENV